MGMAATKPRLLTRTRLRAIPRTRLKARKKKAPLKVGFAVPDEAHPYFIAQIGAIKKRVQEQGGELLVANAGMDVNKQINNIENLVSSKVQAMIVFPIDPKPLEDSLKKSAGCRD